MDVKVLIEDKNASLYGSIDNIAINYSSNNISTYNNTSTYSDNVLSESSNTGKKAFLLGESKLGDGSVYASNYDGYISYVSSDDEGNIEDFHIYIYGNVKSLRIQFDPISNQYATEIKINNNIITSNTYYINYEFEEVQTEMIDIQITKWNNPNSYIRITSIVASMVLEYGINSGLLNFTSGQQIIDDNTSPKYGLISNYGNFKIIDVDLKIEKLAEQNLLTYEKEVKIFLNNNIIGTYITSTFEKEGNVVSVELKDKLLELQNITVPKRFFGDTTLMDVFDYLLNILEENGYVFINAYEFYNVFREKEIKNCNIVTDTLWEQLTKLCQCIGIRIFLDENGNLKGGYL